MTILGDAFISFKMEKTILVSYYSSPCGDMIVGDYEGKLCLCDWANSRHRALTDRKLCEALGASFEKALSSVTEKAMAELDEYFAGTRRAFDLPLLLNGTAFQRRVWQSLQQIDYASTITYADQAIQLGNPRSTRAVAAADGKNPIAIIVPCHRVVGSNGAMTGYAGGLEVKRYLLNLEQKHCSSCPTRR